MKIKKLKLKKPVVKILKIVSIIFLVFLSVFLIFRFQIHQLMKLDYSYKASKNILFKFKKDYIISVGSNQTLNAAFESKDYIEDNLDSYAKVKYQNHKHIIKNINTLIEKGYSNNHISLILAHGSDSDVLEFAKRDKIRYLEEFYSIDYAKLKYYDRYVAFSDTTGEDEETTVLYVNLGMDKDPYLEPVEVKDFSTVMLVNKYYHLGKDFEPNDLIKIDEKYTNGEEQSANKEAVNAFISMYNAAKSEGLELVINSSYRSYNDQQDLCNEYAKVYGNNYVQKYVAKPGFSEHQTGLAFDIGSTSINVFKKSNEYQWMLNNAYKYGFIQRFTKEKSYITGFNEEPWHYRYVGTKVAKYIYENDITLEEYYAKFLDI